MLAARLQTNGVFATEEPAQAVVEQSRGCRATYSNQTRRLCPETEPPRIALPCTVTSLDAPLGLLDLLRQRPAGLGQG